MYDWNKTELQDNTQMERKLIWKEKADGKTLAKLN